MKKTILIIVSVILVLILSAVTCFYVWGGKPYIKNFGEVSSDYETVAKMALHYYKDISPNEEYIIIDVYEDYLKHDETVLQLTPAQKDSVATTEKAFNYLRVCKDAVFFCEDETGYYGLVYSTNPLSALYEAGLPQNDREYHRINSRWYEWGVWGI